MSKTEILEALTHLTAADRGVVWECLWELEERGLVEDRGPTDDEKALLDRELEAYQRDRDGGSPWPEVAARLRRKAPA
ncbi:MAG: hypothetical protein A3K19_18710 [Lentisphaerae bacterium RIFOXYB12_FULL_65_16]|nr:MAG: hypothetical protein A3K18_26160 [Lentisphaerae bacterium RIFOXYA12_64_32]OGV92455.1 MAG: hypothetical protein A3K19_18710 [Lentisphaerae bacterium RIFOXYB12_FULL_65_16]